MCKSGLIHAASKLFYHVAQVAITLLHLYMVPYVKHWIELNEIREIHEKQNRRSQCMSVARKILTK